MEINWIKKYYCPPVSEADITISINKSQNSYQTTFSFRNESAARITTTDYIAVGITPNRLYFRAASIKDGYYLSKPTPSRIRRFKIANMEKRLVGDYQLLWDKNEALYYIDISKPEKRGETHE